MMYPQAINQDKVLSYTTLLQEEDLSSTGGKSLASYNNTLLRSEVGGACFELCSRPR